jgi:hypothetical protein
MAEDIVVVCAWCASVAEHAGKAVSHGICPACAMKMLKRLPQEYLEAIAEADGTVSLFSGEKFQVVAQG